MPVVRTVVHEVSGTWPASGGTDRLSVHVGRNGADRGVPAGGRVEITVSSSLNVPGSLSATVADNIGTDAVLVRGGPLAFNTGDFPGDSTAISPILMGRGAGVGGAAAEQQNGQ